MAFRLWAVACLAVLTCGCQGDRFPIVPVSGRVMLNGTPLAGAHVMFQPFPDPTAIESGPESVGETDAEGRFKLHTIEPERNGAMVGKHAVRITIQDEEDRFGGVEGGGARGPAKYTIPLRYRVGTELSAEVPPAGTDKIEFLLTSP